MKIRLLWVILFLTITPTLWSQKLTIEEQKLYDLIMQYRTERGLPVIPLSPSLTIVAQTHAKDLAINRPDKGSCNAHSWSNHGNWIPVCYTSNHAQAKLMYSKPSELTNYKGNGYEIVTMIYGTQKDLVMTPTTALKSWKGSAPHNAVIINSGMWKSSEWQSIGIGMYKGYACVWFGEEPDTTSQFVNY